MKRGAFLIALLAVVYCQLSADSNAGLDYLERIAESEPVEALALAAQLWPSALDELSQARILNAEATAYTVASDFARALDCARRAEAIAVRNRLREPLAYALLNQASVLRRQSQYDRSYELAMRSLRLFEEAGSLRGQLRSANRVSTILFELGDYERGLEFNERSLGLALKLKDVGEEAAMLSNRAYLYFQKKDYPAMLRLSLQAIEKYKTVNEESAVRYPLINAGVAHLELGNLSAAERFLSESIPISRRVRDESQEMIALKFLARTHKNLNDLDRARREALQALATGRRLGNRFEVKNICAELADICSRQGDTRAAYGYLTEAMGLQEQLQAGGARERISRSLKQYEIEKKENQIRLLQQEKTIAELQARQQRSQRNSLLGIAAVLLSAVFFITTAFLAKRKANRAVLALNGELQDIDQVVREINKEFDLPALIDSIFHRTLQLLPQTEKGGFLYFAEEQGVFRPATWYGYTPAEVSALALPALDAARRYKLGAQTMAPGIHLVRDPENAFGSGEIARLIPIPKSILAIDLEVDGRTLGYLLFENMRRVDAFNGPDIGKLTRVREHLISAIAKAHYIERLKRVSRADLLTGLLNRGGMMELLEKERERFQRYGAPLAVAIGAPDNLARIGEVHGREGSDLALRHTAEIMKSRLRKVDSVARWGDGEFLLLMPQTNVASAVAAVAKLAQEVRGDRLHHKGQELGLTLSFGVGELSKGLALEDFLRAVAEALRAAAEQGRERIATVPVVGPIPKPGPDGSA